MENFIGGREQVIKKGSGRRKTHLHEAFQPMGSGYCTEASAKTVVHNVTSDSGKTEEKYMQMYAYMLVARYFRISISVSLEYHEMTEGS